MPVPAGPLLAIDTSTEVVGIALYGRSGISELIWRAGRNQTSSLMPAIRRLLSCNDVDLNGIGAIAVANGPGTFNGLRVGMSVAKGLAYALRVPIVAVPTLDVVAYPHAPTRRAIRAFVSAGRGRVVYADYRHRNGRWERASELRNEPLEHVVSGIGERTVVVGELSEDQAHLLEEHPQVILPAAALRLRRPSYLAEIARGRLLAGEIDAIEAIEPIYVHSVSRPDSVAVSN